MTDNEIKKALECCSRNTEYDCNHCSYFVDDEITTTQCMCNLMKLALDLINRRDAEIERLKDLEKNVYETVAKLINKIKAEARKEFTERLKGLSEYGTINLSPWQVDNLVKEMEGK